MPESPQTAPGTPEPTVAPEPTRQPVVPVKPTEHPLIFAEMGRPGLVHMGGSIYEEFLPKLQGLSGVRVYKEMRENSAVVGAMMFAVESLLRSVQWKTEPASEDPEHLDAAKFLEECRHDMSHSWSDFISEVLTMLTYGWSYFEIVYKVRGGPQAPTSDTRSRYSDGRVGWRKFAPRSQDSLYEWEFDGDGGIRGLWQQTNPDPGAADYKPATVFIPIEKALLFRTTSQKNNPEGRSVLRTAYRAYHFAKRLQEIEAIGTERSIAGLPVARVPIELLASDRSAAATTTFNYIKEIVTRTKVDETMGVIFPLAYDDNGNELFKFELLSAGGAGKGGGANTREMISGYHQEIAMTMMADFLMLGHSGVGSYALSSDKTELFSVALEAWLDGIEDTINRYAVPRLMELNGLDTEMPPKIRHSAVEAPNLQELGGYLANLANAGATLFPDLLLDNKLREAAKLPEIDPEAYEQRLAQQQEQQMMQMMAGMGGGPGGPGAGGEGEDEEGGGFPPSKSSGAPPRPPAGFGGGPKPPLAGGSKAPLSQDKPRRLIGRDGR